MFDFDVVVGLRRRITKPRKRVAIIHGVVVLTETERSGGRNGRAFDIDARAFFWRGFFLFVVLIENVFRIVMLFGFGRDGSFGMIFIENFLRIEMFFLGLFNGCFSVVFIENFLRIVAFFGCFILLAVF